MSKKRNHQPNPKRAAAGRANRQKRGPLTQEGRERLRQAAQTNRPWEHSTGPRTPQGRMQARLNGKKRQVGAISIREARAELARVRALLRAIRETCAGISQP
jgi:hypothetical protein